MKQTGFCLVGSHEGQQPKSPSGKALKTCKFWQDCSCVCHREITEMFELGGRERVLVDVSNYEPEVGRFWMPTPEFMAALRADVGTGRGNDPGSGEWTVGDASRAADRAFAPTPSGYRARGQLEAEVMRVCDEWDTGKGPVSLPLSFIATQINEHEPPSVGAIREVLLRWVKYGFAILGQDPLAFRGYMEAGRKEGLDVLKYKYEQNRRMNRAKADRGYR